MLIVFCSQYAIAQEYQCVWYGQCNQDELGRFQNCLYEGPAKDLEMEGQTFLKKWCPHYFESKGKLKFILLPESTIVTLNVEKKWVGVVFDDC